MLLLEGEGRNNKPIQFQIKEKIAMLKVILRKSLLILSLLVMMLVSACAQTTTPNNPNQSSGLEPFVVKGKIVDNNGVPLAGVEVVANNTIFFDSNGLATTDANGNYRIELINGSWHMTASMMRDLNGQSYRVDLTPDNDVAFAGSEGAIRNFVWQSSGRKAQQGSVFAYADITVEFLEAQYIELTLEPQGALLDGSAGQTITGMLTHTADGDGLINVPLGRYKITVRYLVPGESPAVLEIKPRNSGEYSDSLTADFETPFGDLAIFWIEVMVKRKGA
jgi:Carboxypeptidase regulatory-like domain